MTWTAAMSASVRERAQRAQRNGYVPDQLLTDEQRDQQRAAKAEADYADIERQAAARTGRQAAEASAQALQAIQDQADDLARRQADEAERARSGGIQTRTDLDAMIRLANLAGGVTNANRPDR